MTTHSTTNSVEQSTPYPVHIADTDYCMVFEAQQNTTAVRAQKRQHVRTLLKSDAEKFIFGANQEDTRTVHARKLVVSAAAILQLTSSESAVPAPELVSRQLNEILPLIGSIQEPPITPEVLSAEQVGTWMSDAEATLRAPLGWAQPHAVEYMHYFDRAVGLHNGSLVFGDTISVRV